MADVAVALDLARAAHALEVVDAIGPAVSWYKVGPPLFVSDGPRLVGQLLARGKRVFLDLKWHDIPSTVAGAVEAAAHLGVALATVHLAGGSRMLAAAVGARRSGLRLVGVGVLTSLHSAEYGDVVGRSVDDLGAEQARLVRGALRAGLDGFVVAVAEARLVRRLAGPEALLVTPGIRRASDAAGDQSRAASPKEAVRAGADLLVVGRPITGSADPLATVMAILGEMAE